MDVSLEELSKLVLQFKPSKQFSRQLWYCNMTGDTFESNCILFPCGHIVNYNSFLKFMHKNLQFDWQPKWIIETVNKHILDLQCQCPVCYCSTNYKLRSDSSISIYYVSNPDFSIASIDNFIPNWVLLKLDLSMIDLKIGHVIRSDAGLYVYDGSKFALVPTIDGLPIWPTWCFVERGYMYYVEFGFGMLIFDNVALKATIDNWFHELSDLEENQMVLKKSTELLDEIDINSFQKVPYPFSSSSIANSYLADNRQVRAELSNDEHLIFDRGNLYLMRDSELMKLQ
jgi:hypothetical protein